MNIGRKMVSIGAGSHRTIVELKGKQGGKQHQSRKGSHRTIVELKVDMDVKQSHDRPELPSHHSGIEST